MTIEDLLKPRVKVIADYPSSIFKIGKIIENIDHWANIVRFEDHPHLFKKLEWWEDRKPEEMPEYVKLEMGSKVQYVHKVEKWVGENYKGQPLYDYINRFGRQLVSACVIEMIPATEQEYKSQLQNK